MNDEIILNTLVSRMEEEKWYFIGELQSLLKPYVVQYQKLKPLLNDNDKIVMRRNDPSNIRSYWKYKLRDNKLKVTHRMVSCPGCGIKKLCTWQLNGMVVLDSDVSNNDIEYGNAQPFTAAHPYIGEVEECKECGTELLGNLKICLVNHGDGTACVTCPECNHDNYGAAIWHKWDWDLHNIELVEGTIERPEDRKEYGIDFGKIWKYTPSDNFVVHVDDTIEAYNVDDTDMEELK